MATPVKSAAEHMNILAKADFTGDMGAKFLKKKDEPGLLARSVDSMSKSVRSVLNNVIGEAYGVKASSKVQIIK